MSNLWMTQNEKRKFMTLLGQSTSYIESGMGGSTVAAIKSGMADIVSIETSSAWIKKMQSELSPDSNAKFFHFSVGPTFRAGHPVFPMLVTKTRIQSNFRKLGAILESRKYDLTLIDGRYRVATAAFLSQYIASAGKLLVHDYSVRPEYWVLESFLTLVSVTDTLAEFKFSATSDNVEKSIMVFNNFIKNSR